MIASARQPPQAGATLPKPFRNSRSSDHASLAVPQFQQSVLLENRRGGGRNARATSRA